MLHALTAKLLITPKIQASTHFLVKNKKQYFDALMMSLKSRC